jgi:hypothetical protein
MRASIGAGTLRRAVASARGDRLGEMPQRVLDEKAFRLEVDDGNQLTIQVNSVSTSARTGYSKVEFSCL